MRSEKASRSTMRRSYKRVSGHGNMPVRDEPLASIIQEALRRTRSSGFSGLRRRPDGRVQLQIESLPRASREMRR